MKTELWNGYEIRFVEKDSEWWAVAKDIAEALGYAKTDNLTKRLKAKHKDTAKWSTLGGEQEMIVLSEHGIYKAIMNSHKPEAEEFEDWVFDTLKVLRKASGLEQYQIFRMIDKEYQKKAMDKLNQSVENPTKVDYIKCNTIANKAVSTQYGYDKMVKKGDMTPEMLVDRQELLNDTVELMGLKDKYGLDISVSEEVYKLAGKNRQQTA